MRTSLPRLPALAALIATPLLLETPAHAIPPPPYAHHVCPNGLEVIVVERHSTPLMTVEIAVHTGAMSEPPEYNGLSHLFEHMFFKGNKALPDQLAYSARVRELGMNFNGTTDNDRVNYYFTTTSDHVADAMVFMRDAITSPLFDKKELDRERVVVTGEMDRNESQPEFLLWRAVEQAVYWKYPSRKNALGDRKTVLSTTPEKMRTIQRRYYTPNNSLLVVTGDVHADDVFRRADELYGAWATAPDPLLKFPLVQHPPIARSKVVVVEQPVQTFNANFNWLGPSSIGPSAGYTYAADLLDQLVRDRGSKFQRDLVDSGACVRARFGWPTVRDQGAISASFEATEANVDRCVMAIKEEIKNLEAPDYFTDAEMSNAAHVMDVNEARRREETESYAHLLTSMWANADLAYYATYSDRIHAVTRSDLNAYLDTYVSGKPFVFGVLESPTLAKTITKAHLESLVGIAAKTGAK